MSNLMPIKSVLVVDGVDAKCAEILKSHGIHVTTKANISKKKLLVEIPNYDALVVQSVTQVTKELLKAGTKLKVVGQAGPLVNNIDRKATRQYDIKVINAPTAYAVSTCELTCGMILALSRHIVPASTALKAGRLEHRQYMGTELNGKTLAILGLGLIGSEIALRMSAFGMKIIVFDPIATAKQCSRFHARKMDLDDIWPFADYIVLNVPLVRSTRYFMNDTIFRLCRKGVKIINIRSSGLINEPHFLEALKSGQVGGAALDVFAQEPPTAPITIEIIRHPAVITTPHLGASSSETGGEIAEQLVNFNKPGTYPDAELSDDWLPLSKLDLISFYV